MNRTGVYAFIYKRALEKEPAAHLETQACLFTSLSVSPLSLSLSFSLCLTGIRSLPANGRRPQGEALSGTGRLLEMAVLLLSISMATQGPGGTSGGVEALELILMESSGYQRPPEFIAGTMNTGACGLGVNESESRSVVCLHSFVFSCHFCRAMSHRVKLVKVRCLFSKEGPGSSNCFDFRYKLIFLCVAGFKCSGIPCPVFRLQR